MKKIVYRERICKSVSIYYTCERDYPLTEHEKQVITQIVDQYNEDFELKEIGETFTVYHDDEKQPEIIFVSFLFQTTIWICLLPYLIG